MSGSPIHRGSTRFPAATAAMTVALAAALAGCAKKSRANVPAPVSATPAPAIGATETGIASWYGVPYHGRRAADGEIYDMEQFTAAHRTLAFNTWVEVTDLDNGKQVEVRITDRGPFVDGRIIDLSLAAARTLDMVGPGTARVRLKIIPAPAFARDPGPKPAPAELYAVQAGAFSDRDRAEAFADSLRDLYKDASVVDSVIRGERVWRVLIARSLPIEDANRLAAKVRDSMGEALVVREP